MGSDAVTPTRPITGLAQGMPIKCNRGLLERPVGLDIAPSLLPQVQI